MSLFLATLLPGLLLATLGGFLVWNDPRVAVAAQALPRSRRAAWVLFGGGAAWFLGRVAQLGEADLIFFQHPTSVLLAFGLLAVLAFVYAPDFLAVRGLCVLVLLAAEPVLQAAYMEWHHPQRLLMVGLVYVALALALYLAASPFRLRDFFAWLFLRPARARGLGAALLAYGFVLVATAFSY